MCAAGGSSVLLRVLLATLSVQKWANVPRGACGVRVVLSVLSVLRMLLVLRVLPRVLLGALLGALLGVLRPLLACASAAAPTS